MQVPITPGTVRSLPQYRVDADLLAETADVHRPAEVPSLGITDPALHEVLRLRFGLHALGHHLQMQRVRHFDDVQHHLAGGAVGIDGFNEGAIDFERVERERLQAGKARVAGAEVVDGHAESLARRASRISAVSGPARKARSVALDLDVLRARSGGDEGTDR